MKFVLNNRLDEISGDKVTVSELLLKKKFTFRLRIIKINGTLIPKDKYGSTFINEGDNVQMLYLMSGG